MKSVLNPNEFSIYHIETEYMNFFEKQYLELYQNWKSIWLETFKELDGAKRIHSDDFLKQDDHVAIFHNESFLGSVSFKFYNLKHPASLDESYFSHWSEEDKSHITEFGSKMVSASYFCLNPKYRKIEIDPPLKYYLMSMVVRRYLASDCDFCTGITRNDKGIDKTVLDFGAINLNTNQIAHNVPVNLVLWSKKYHDFYGDIENWVDSKWSQRKILFNSKQYLDQAG